MPILEKQYPYKKASAKKAREAGMYDSITRLTHEPPRDACGRAKARDLGCGSRDEKAAPEGGAAVTDERRRKMEEAFSRLDDVVFLKHHLEGADLQDAPRLELRVFDDLAIDPRAVERAIVMNSELVAVDGDGCVTT
jgi:hypothetical protein